MGFSTSKTVVSLCLFTFFWSAGRADQVYVSSISINFTASSLSTLDNNGVFLVSEKRSFGAQIRNSISQGGASSFYLVVVHRSSATTVWSANRNRPVLSPSSHLRLTADGLTLYDNASQPIWSTPRNGSSPAVSSMHLLESGNLLLRHVNGDIVWQSFDFPTDVLVARQRLRVGSSLVASSPDGEMSEGSYRLVIAEDDATLQWNGIVYWKLSMHRQAFRYSAAPVEFLMVNISGVFLIGGSGEDVIVSIKAESSGNSSDLVLAKVDYGGLLSVVSLGTLEIRSQQEVGPDDKCQTPAICGRLGVCSNRGSCSCAPGYRENVNINGGVCVPTDASLLLPASSCNKSSSSSSELEYMSLGDGLDYFSNDFTPPVAYDVDVSFCQHLCTKNCSCLGVFFAQSSGSCFMIRNYLGSMVPGSGNRVGYIKVLANRRSRNVVHFPTLVVVMVVSLLIVAMVTLVFLRCRRKNRGSSYHQGMDVFSIPGLPLRLDYEEVAEATQGLSTQIGSGGFGTVYKGALRGGSEVAVKKIRSLEAQGKREFLTEIAVIGKIRHANLVKLKGFCVHGDQRFLVYEYMNRGSLEHSLFQGGEAVLEWRDRYKIAVGAARGLEYLHNGCESKIIHCDVKPENILLNDQLQVKVSDFGLSKLISKEQSGFFTTLRGTRGYVAPEWLTNTPISDKTDVYSYGMVLLEIISGVRNFSFHEESVVSFPTRALEMHVEKRYMELVDLRLEGNAPSEEVERLVRVALCCLHRDPNLRPSMANVVRMLQGEIALCKPRIKLLNFLRVYGVGVGAVAENELSLDREEMNNSFSYISSHQVSGPR